MLLEIFEQLEKSSDYRARMTAVEEFTSKSRTHVKGLAMSAVKFGISFTTKFLNQGNALVNVYTDGTVQVSTGGTEMGQGLNTKIRQLVADEFDIDPSCVKLMPTSTEKSNNTSPTAARRRYGSERLGSGQSLPPNSSQDATVCGGSVLRP